MFSYLRSNNRRSALSPVSTPYLGSTRQTHSLQGSTEDFGLKHPYRSPDQPNPSPISPLPPILPPIPRVASRQRSNRNHDSQVSTAQDESDLSGDESPEKAKAQVPQSLALDERASVGKVENEQRPMGPPPQSLQLDPQFWHGHSCPPNPMSDSLRSYSEPFPTYARAEPPEQPKGGARISRAPPPAPLKLSSTPRASATSGRQGKTRFNLRNPMSLLARRRSHQVVAEAKANNEKAQSKSAHPPVPGLPEDFDPRIRGKVVHDFSAPRPGTHQVSNSARDSDRRQREAILYNSRKPSPNPSTALLDDETPSSGEREHTPQFKEHFDDDIGPLKDGPAKKRTSAFMYQMSLSASQPDPDPSGLPPFARQLPSNVIAATDTVPQSLSPPPKKSLDIVPETRSTDALATDIARSSPPPTSPPAKPRSRASSNTESQYQPAGLPKHFKSNASRFSFDLAGKGSAAQEKLLEEKHRENERKRARRSNDSAPHEDGIVDDDGDYSDHFDGLNDDDSLEEKILGVNADADEPSALETQGHTQVVNLVLPEPSSFTSVPGPTRTGVTSPSTPRDSIYPPAGLAAHQIFPRLDCAETTDEFRSYSDEAKEKAHSGSIAHCRPVTASDSRESLSQAPCPDDYDEDDLYFDDGMIEDLEISEGQLFDESFFDDDTSRTCGLPLRNRNRPGTISDACRVKDSPKDAAQRFTGPAAGSGDILPQYSATTHSSISQTARLADLTAYHDALATKVNQAAVNGAFARRPSLGPTAEDVRGSTAEPPEADASWNAVIDRKVGNLFLGGGIEDGDGFEVDDALADDSIIAAANAEVLENDDEGFYGQEFGFFARASGAIEAEYANGGYFGSRAFEGLGRSHSGRGNEPSLTPITERSEWSNRNSAISLAMHGFQPPSAGPMPSPGLAQLADMMHLEEDDMSLTALMKLRRGAWGGSNASLHSSSSGSPLTYLPGVGFPAAIPIQQSNGGSGNFAFPNGSPLAIHGDPGFASSYSLSSSKGFNSSNDSSPGSATITQSSQQQTFLAQQPPQGMPALLPQQQQLHSPVPVLSPPFAKMSQQSQRRSLSPVKRSSMGPPPKPCKGHSRNSSNASESVSYVQEIGGEDGSQGRWVLEKRRVDESGVIEVLGREIVQGGRI
ncbi:MAG: hypothetical protein LQ344_001292 [Seirophora lacunosa]|nr:MAG: hypothetical protein LQ344_001292 [Seirophora lacunosa]